MGTKETIKLFEERKVRTAWDDEQEKWYFSIVDVVQVLTDSDYQTARKYWKVLKGRIVQEAGQPVTICYQLKMRAICHTYRHHLPSMGRQNRQGVQGVEEGEPA